jgi:hypothetical protein
MEQIKFRTKIIDNESGFTMIITLMILLLLTVLGVAAMNTSVLETMISSADLKKRIAFNAAEAGIDHASGMIKSRLPKNLTSGSLLPLSSALDGTWAGNASTASTNCSGSQWTACFNAGDHLLTNQPIENGYSYTVSVRNNNDGGDATTDKDGFVYVSSLGFSLDPLTNKYISSAAVEICLHAYLSSVSSIASYTAQMAAGAGKSSSSTDTVAVSSANLGNLSAVTDQSGSKVY